MKKVSVLIPALNEEKNISTVINCIKKINIVDEIIVIDNNSSDDTNKIAKSLGVKTILCKQRGKGYAMEHGIKHATHDIIVFVDADISNYSENFIDKLVEPILKRDCDLVKSNFTRDGGRVTELVAKPLLELLFPGLKKYEQPLSGIVAGKKDFFKSLNFEKDYGIDIGILIDAHLLNAKVEEVHIGDIKNDSQDWKDLKNMAKQVSKAILKRTNRFNIK